MAQKRMFSKDVVRTDKFLDMSLSSQALYFHLNMDADVKGFVSPRSVMRMINATADDLNVLIHKGFVIPFESGVVVVTHWNINNNVRASREATTQFIEESKKLISQENDLYKLQENSRSTTGVLPPRLDEIRLDEIRLVEREAKVEEKEKENKLGLRDLLSLNNFYLKKYSNKFTTLTEEEILNESEKAYHWCKSKGKIYKDYNSFLIGWLQRAVSYKALHSTKATSSNYVRRTKII